LPPKCSFKVSSGQRRILFDPAIPPHFLTSQNNYFNLTFIDFSLKVYTAIKEQDLNNVYVNQFSSQQIVWSEMHG
jgi:hypothetical protein